MSGPGSAYLPVIVFVAETCVVTLCTMRTIFVTRGWRAPAACLGFFEVSTWLFAIGQVMQNLHRLDCAAAFAGGFALGNYLGVTVEQKLALGHVIVQVTSRHDVQSLVNRLRLSNYGVTSVRANGTTGPVQVVSTVVPRRELTNVLGLIQEFDRQAFYAIHNLNTTTAGVFPNLRGRPRPRLSETVLEKLGMATVSASNSEGRDVKPSEHPLTHAA